MEPAARTETTKNKTHNHVTETSVQGEAVGLRNWNITADKNLLKTIKDVLSETETRQSPRTGAYNLPQDINWIKVAEGFSRGSDVHVDVDFVKARWKQLTAKIRKLRTVEEIIGDIELDQANPKEKRSLRTKVGQKRRYIETLPENERPPKRPVSAYILFCNSQRPKMHRKYPDMKETDIMKQLGRKWHDLKPSKKEKYTKKTEQAKIQYAEEFKAWSELHPDLHEQMLNVGKTKAVHENQRPPKRPPSAFLLFCSSKRTHLCEKYPDMKETDIMKELGKKWNSLTPSRKEKYIKRAGKAKVKYAEEFKVWCDEHPGHGKANNVSPKPTKPQSAFHLFCDKKTAGLKSKYPSISDEDLKVKLTKRWTKLSEEKCSQYISEAHALEEEYQKKLEQWLLLQQKIPSKKKSANSDGQNSGLKKPLTSFILFCKDNRSDMHKQYPGTSPRDITKLLSENWRALSDEERKTYTEKAKELKMQYQENVKILMVKQRDNLT